MVVLVTTVQHSGIDRYGQELARRLSIPTIETRRYRSPRETLRLLRRLRRSPCIVHFPSQHFARYEMLLRRPFIVTVHDLVRMCFPFAKETVLERVRLKFDALGLRKAEHIIGP